MKLAAFDCLTRVLAEKEFPERKPKEKQQNIIELKKCKDVRNRPCFFI